MTPLSADNGPTLTQLWSGAWVLGLVAVGAGVRLAVFAGDGAPVESGHFVWAVVCCVCAVFSAAAALLAGVKAAEARVKHQVEQLQARDS